MYHERNRQILMSSALILVLVLIVLIAAMAVLLNHYFKAPFLNLIRRIDQLADGDYGQRQLSARQMEIQAITTRFNAMAAQIQSRETRLNEMNVILVAEIEERKKVERELRDHKEHLEELVDERTRDLRRAKDAAEAANRAKSVFLSSMSHELRTPLNAILGFAQILTNDIGLSERQRNYVGSIYRGGDYLLSLINDVLDLAKIEAGRFELYPRAWDTHTFFLDLQQMTRMRATQKDITFTCETSGILPQTLYCDEQRLRQIALNLLGNAVKFTDRGGVTLRSWFKDGMLTLEVEDNGIGIASDQLDKIFEPFHQSGESQYKKQGTGLGLSITRRLVNAMDGTLRVASSLGEGSTFTVEVPVEAVSTIVEAHREQPLRHYTGYRRTRGKGSFRILITDDIADNREVLTGLLEPLGFVCAEASNGVQCLEIAQKWQPDAVLMDVRMPEMDGLEATRRLRAMPAFQEIPIIAVTASAFKEELEGSLFMGCNLHLPKPVNLNTLLDGLGRFLPLEWEYSEGDPAAELKNQNLSLSQLEAFENLLLQGDISGIVDFATHLEQRDCCPGLAHKIADLGAAFDLTALGELLETLRKKPARSEIHANLI